jgi:hypothetical protein
MSRSPRRPASSTFNDEQLRWVATNRKPSDRRSEIGALATDVAGRRMAQASRFGPVYEAICDLADDQFRAFCRIKSVNTTTLSVLAKNHDCQYTIEKEWGPRIRRALRDVCAGIGPFDVRFLTAKDEAEWDDAVIIQKRF